MTNNGNVTPKPELSIEDACYHTWQAHIVKHFLTMRYDVMLECVVCHHKQGVQGVDREHAQTLIDIFKPIVASERLA